MRILLVSDIHANLPAISAVLQEKREFADVWNLGDTVGYGGSPNECIELLQNLPSSHWLAGNHDLAATGSLTTDRFNPVAAEAARWTRNSLSAANRDFLNSLTSIKRADEYLLAHGSPRSPVSEYVRELQAIRENLNRMSGRICLVGHTHIPMAAREDPNTGIVNWLLMEEDTELSLSSGRFFINPGSVGQPRDGDSRAAYASLDTGNRTIRFSRVRYDVGLAQQQIREAGLPEMLATRLAHGQ